MCLLTLSCFSTFKQLLLYLHTFRGQDEVACSTSPNKMINGTAPQSARSNFVFSNFISVFCGMFWMCACSSEEAKTKIPHKVSASLAQALEKLDLSKKAEKEKLGQSQQCS